MTPDLDRAMRSLLAERAVHGVASIVRRPSAYYSSFPIEELDVTLHNGDRLLLLIKDVGIAAMLPQARRIKPAFLIDPTREARVYRDILTPYCVEAPAFWGAYENPAEARQLLVLERVTGRPLWQVGEFDVWLEVARWLGAMHSRLATALHLFRATVPLVRCDHAFYRVWLERALAKLASPRASSEAAELAAILPVQYEKALAVISALPLIFIHGEFHASNVLVRDQPVRGDRVCAIDWEMAALGPGLMDLADLTSGKWRPPERARLADAYCSALAPGAGPPPERFGRAFEACRFQRAVQWLGWADGDWRPPAEHAHDWLSDALELARSRQFQG